MKQPRHLFLYISFVCIFLFATLVSSAPPAFSIPKTTFQIQQLQPVVQVVIKKIVVTGNTLLSDSEIRSVVSPYEGKKMSFADASRIAYAITFAYRRKGYILAYAYVPYQRIVNGALHINVLEGKVGQIRVEGNQHYSTDFILWHFKTAIKNGTLQYDALQKALLILNEFNDLHVQSFLFAGRTPGTTDVLLKVQDSLPVHVVGDYNNYGNPSSGEHQPSLNLLFGNVGIQGSTLNYTALWSFPNLSTTISTPIATASYDAPVNNHGTKVKGFYTSSDVRLGGALYSALGVIGNTNITAFSVSNPIARSFDHSSNFTATLNIKSSHNFVNFVQTTRDKIRDVALAYDTNWIAGRGSNTVSGTVTEGLGTFLGGNSNTEGISGPIGNTTPISSTKYASNHFTKVNVNFTRYQLIGDNGDMLILKGDAQWALSPLLLPEQYLLGGPESVRGYREAETNGDEGMEGTVEFRFPLIARPGTSVMFGIFTDMGRINSFNNAGAGTPGVKHLTGYGFGFRANIGDNTALRADFGFPVDPLSTKDTNSNATKEGMVPYLEFSTKFF